VVGARASRLCPSFSDKVPSTYCAVNLDFLVPLADVSTADVSTSENLNFEKENFEKRDELKRTSTAACRRRPKCKWNLLNHSYDSVQRHAFVLRHL
jgi:hypothetical protein